MKKLFISLMVMSVAFVACEQDGLTVSFDLDYDTDVTIEKALVTDLGVPFDVTSPAINTSSEKFANENTQLDKVEEAKLNSVVLTILTPEAQTWSFVNEVKIYIKGQGLTEELIASETDIDVTSGVLELDVQDVDVAAHVKSGEFTMRASITTDETVDEDVEVNTAVSMKVKASAL